MGGLFATTVPDALTFAIAACLVIGGGLGVVLSHNPVHAALMLVMTLIGIAVLFVEEDAQFLAAVQVIVYTGAIVVLFLFVIMLLGIDRRERVFADTFKGQRLIAGVLGIFVLVEVLLLGSGHWSTGAHAVAGSLHGPGGNVNDIADSLFTTYLLPFEVTSALLVVAVIGAVVLARRPRGEHSGEVEGSGDPDESPLATEEREEVAR